VDVYAYDKNDTPVLYGSEVTTIYVGQVTEGGEIEMKLVDDNQQDTGLPSFTINDLGMTFMRIPAGEFVMGSPEEELGRGNDENQHQVRITQYFYLQTTEVTQRQWRMVVLATENSTLNPDPSRFTDCGDDCPVESVSWDNVQLFIDYLNIRYEGDYEFYLPTEAQWEYAARAESDTAFANGDITVTDCGLDPVLDPMGWYCFNSGNVTHPVGGKNANGFGLFDMYGNAGEWCQDYYEEVYSHTTEPVIDPQGPSNGEFRVMRGGSRYSHAADCRSSERHWHLPDDSEGTFGFRLICSPLSN
jgi:formylglycine-generating enzyme required for sulfatase activity